MSKRQSVGQKNTLLNYFQSPKGKSTPKKTENTEPPSNLKKAESSDDSDEEDVKLPRKRSRIAVVESSDYDDSENENKPTPKKSKIKRTAKKARLESDENSSDNEDKKKKLGGAREALKAFAFNKTSDEPELKQSKKNLALTKTKNNIPELKDMHSNWLHNHLGFLKPAKIKDAMKRMADDPEYDPRTLYVPEAYLQSLTPAMRQWWILKGQHMDSVLFFKVGKFYELYHMDAVIGVIHLGFSYMKGEFAHSGFPESAYAKMASILIDKGFKVARVEQTETPDMMNERCKQLKKTTKFDKVVKREICQISTKATCVYTAQMSEARQSLPYYLYAISEKQLSNGKVRFGVTFVDTSIGTFYLSEFDDDKYNSRLLVLLSERAPGLVLTERCTANTQLKVLLKTYFRDVQKDTLASKKQFWTATSTLENLYGECYFRDKDDKFEWPAVFQQLADDCIPKPAYELALKCLGACIWYLKDSEIDIQVLSMKKFEIYEPMDLLTKKTMLVRDYMVLDAVTMSNLSLLGGKGSLQKTLDHCETAFGRRLLLQWICRPLCNIEKILERQKAVKELWNNPSLLKATQDLLRKLPDLERQVAKIHTYGNRFCAKNHPDSRAIFYEAATYSKRKIIDLLKTLKGFERIQEIPSLFKGCDSRLLRKITQFAPEGSNIDLTATLQFFREVFDQNKAEKEHKIIPSPGAEPDYDSAEEAVQEIHQKLAIYLKEQQKFFGCQISYFGTDKKRFQLEVPEERTNKVTMEYQLEGTKRGSKPAKRYSTPTSRTLLAEMLKAEADRAKIILDLNRRIYEKFGQRQNQWQQVTQCLAILDVFCSLGEYARTFSQDICMPEVKIKDDKPQIIIENGRHPCVLNIDTFVPNDTKMGVDGNAGILIITGPNMGGKSTLMRQIAIISVMAQMGSCVPASNCSLTLIDRIFTRLGAYDHIVQGQSTFFVELSEASSILQHATQNSLVLLDELGRGTSTHDGNAIATAYVRKLTEIKCRTLFSTHYHSLVDYFVGKNDVQLGHMACIVENDGDPSKESVTFLYNIVEGRCPKSHGFNVARLAGLKHNIVARGREVAKELEEESKNRNIFTKLFSSSVEEVRKLLSTVNI